MRTQTLPSSKTSGSRKTTVIAAAAITAGIGISPVVATAAPSPALHTDAYSLTAAFDLFDPTSWWGIGDDLRSAGNPINDLFYNMWSHDGWLWGGIIDPYISTGTLGNQLLWALQGDFDKLGDLLSGNWVLRGDSMYIPAGSDTVADPFGGNDFLNAIFDPSKWFGGGIGDLFGSLGLGDLWSGLGGNDLGDQSGLFDLAGTTSFIMDIFNPFKWDDLLGFGGLIGDGDNDIIGLSSILDPSKWAGILDNILGGGLDSLGGGTGGAFDWINDIFTPSDGGGMFDWLEGLFTPEGGAFDWLNDIFTSSDWMGDLFNW